MATRMQSKRLLHSHSASLLLTHDSVCSTILFPLSIGPCRRGFADVLEVPFILFNMCINFTDVQWVAVTHLAW